MTFCQKTFRRSLVLGILFLGIGFAHSARAFDFDAAETPDADARMKSLSDATKEAAEPVDDAIKKLDKEDQAKAQEDLKKEECKKQYAKQDEECKRAVDKVRYLCQKSRVDNQMKDVDDGLVDTLQAGGGSSQTGIIDAKTDANFSKTKIFSTYLNDECTEDIVDSCKNVCKKQKASADIEKSCQSLVGKINAESISCDGAASVRKEVMAMRAGVRGDQDQTDDWRKNISPTGDSQSASGDQGGAVKATPSWMASIPDAFNPTSPSGTGVFPNAVSATTAPVDLSKTFSDPGGSGFMVTPPTEGPIAQGVKDLPTNSNIGSWDKTVPEQPKAEAVVTRGVVTGTPDQTSAVPAKPDAQVVRGDTAQDKTTTKPEADTKSSGDNKSAKNSDKEKDDKDDEKEKDSKKSDKQASGKDSGGGGQSPSGGDSGAKSDSSPTSAAATDADKLKPVDPAELDKDKKILPAQEANGGANMTGGDQQASATPTGSSELGGNGFGGGSGGASGGGSYSGGGGGGNLSPGRAPSSAESVKARSKYGSGMTDTGGSYSRGGSSAAARSYEAARRSTRGGSSYSGGGDNGGNQGQAIDLHQYLPGGEMDAQKRGIASLNSQGIHGSNTILWGAIQMRYNSLSPTLEP